MFPVIPAPPPCGVHPPSLPLWGPVCYHLFLTGTSLGYGWGRALSGERGRECRKRHPILGRCVEWGGVKGRGTLFLRAPSTCNKLYLLHVLAPKLRCPLFLVHICFDFTTFTQSATGPPSPNCAIPLTHLFINYTIVHCVRILIVVGLQLLRVLTATLPVLGIIRYILVYYGLH